MSDRFKVGYFLLFFAIWVVAMCGIWFSKHGKPNNDRDIERIEAKIDRIYSVVVGGNP